MISAIVGFYAWLIVNGLKIFFVIVGVAFLITLFTRDNVTEYSSYTRKKDE